MHPTLSVLLRKATLPLTLASLVACGGGDGDTAAAPPAATVSPTTTCGLPDFVAGTLARVNQVRAAGATCGSHGSFGPAGTLAWNDKLTQAAAGHSQDMAARNYFSHDSQDGRSFRDRIDATGYVWSSIGENIAAGQQGINNVIDAWVGSPDHCANLMNPAFTEIGMACVPGTSANTYATYWTMELGRPR